MLVRDVARYFWQVTVCKKAGMARVCFARPMTGGRIIVGGL
jgi:hypothetical protein